MINGTELLSLSASHISALGLAIYWIHTLLKREKYQREENNKILIELKEVITELKVIIKDRIKRE